MRCAIERALQLALGIRHLSGIATAQHRFHQAVSHPRLSKFQQPRVGLLGRGQGCGCSERSVCGDGQPLVSRSHHAVRGKLHAPALHAAVPAAGAARAGAKAHSAATSNAAVRILAARQCFMPEINRHNAKGRGGGIERGHPRVAGGAPAGSSLPSPLTWQSTTLRAAPVPWRTPRLVSRRLSRR